MTLTRIVIIRLVQTAHLHRVTHLSIIDSKTKGFPRTSHTPTRGPPRSSKTMTSTNCRTMEHTPSICSSWCQMHLWPRHPSQKQARSLMWDSPTLWNWPWTSCPQCSRKCYEEKRSPPTGAKCCTCWNNNTRCHTLFTIVVELDDWGHFWRFACRRLSNKFLDLILVIWSKFALISHAPIFMLKSRPW